MSSLIPSNIVAAAGANAMLPVIVFFSLFAVASTRLTTEPRRALAVVFEGLAGAMMVVIGWVLAIAPIGVFGLAFGVAAGSGGAAIGALAHYIVIVTTIGTMVFLGGYAMAVTGGKRSLPAFARAMLPAQTVAFSTQSSLASLPAMLVSCRRLSLRENTAEFSLPLATALFRATGPGMNMAVAVYAAHLTGVTLTPMVLAAGILTAFATTFGAVSLPGAISFVTSVGPIAIAMGVPVEPLALLVAVEMLPDLMRTIGNVTMDVAITTVVDRSQRRCACRHGSLNAATSGLQLDVPIEPVSPGLVQVVGRKRPSAFLQLPAGRPDRRDQRRHLGLLGGASAFLHVAWRAGGEDVLPTGAPTQSSWHNVIERQVRRAAAILAAEPIAQEHVEAGEGRKFGRLHILAQRDHRGNLHRPAGRVHRAFVRTDDIDTLQHDRLDRRLPGPQAERIIGEWRVIRIQNEAGQSVRLREGSSSALRNRAARSISSDLSMASCCRPRLRFDGNA